MTIRRIVGVAVAVGAIAVATMVLVDQYSVDSIVFVYASWAPDQREVITDPDAIAEILGQLRYDEKEPAPCAHTAQIICRRKSGKVTTASICSHCYVIADGQNPKIYRMPPGLFKIFETRAAAFKAQ